MANIWQQAPICEQLHDDGIAEAKATAWRLLPAQRAQQAVVPPAARDRSQLPLTVKGLENNACSARKHASACAYETIQKVRSAQQQIHPTQGGATLYLPALCPHEDASAIGLALADSMSQPATNAAVPAD